MQGSAAFTGEENQSSETNFDTEHQAFAEIQPEPTPPDDTDFDGEKYAAVLNPSERMPPHKQKPDSFFQDDIPNIDRLEKGQNLYETALGLLHRGKIPQATEMLEAGIVLLEQYVYHKYERGTIRTFRLKMCEHVVDLYCHLAFCFQKASKHKAAKVQYLKAIKYLKEDTNRGEQLVQVAMNLAEVYAALEQPAKSVAIIEIHLELAKEFLEPFHYAGALSNLTIHLADCTRWGDAIDSGNEALTLFEDSLGYSHPYTIEFVKIYLRIVAAYGDRELYKEIEQTYSQYTKDSIPGFEEMKRQYENPAENSQYEQQKMKQELDKQAERLEPYFKIADKAMNKPGPGVFSDGLARDYVKYKKD